MTELVLIRHAETAWNAAKRIQGQRDVRLSPRGRVMAAGWTLPRDLAAHRWFSSTLDRARETAHLLGHPEATPLAALNEMNWGTWAGETLTDLRARHGDTMIVNEARGLDFRPEGGESPRDVQSRLRPLLMHLAAARRPCVAVAHRGVIRALYCLASGWDLTGKPPVEFDREALQRFTLSKDGTPAVLRLNERLRP
ncbi:histidine phosphatase family protein [Algihabitans albus]|uniref:histidine phosphatase family protein n=1 Tax=Algihabitans albus TaxID=2164067 RepID=UPI000E5CFA79|nr:histidine phosphatase family protein [Algihabitans albus]